MAVVVVDDTDSSIEYVGDWAPSVASPNSSFPPGFFFDNTFHQLERRGNISTLLYQFYGNEFIIGGAINLAASQTKPDITVLCTVDDIPLKDPPPLNHVGVLFFSPHSLSEARHTINLTVDAPTGSTAQVWVDFIRFKTHQSPSATTRKWLFPSNSRMRYSAGWEHSQSDHSASFSGHQTNRSNQTLNFEFEGNSFAWLNCPSDTNANLSPANVTFTIDKKPYTASSNNSLVLFDQRLDAGKHDFQIVNKGHEGQMPLTFCGFVIGNSSSSDTMTSAGNSTATSSSSKADHTVGIVSAVVGALSLCLLISLALILVHRRRNKHDPETGRRAPLSRLIVVPFSRASRETFDIDPKLV